MTSIESGHVPGEREGCADGMAPAVGLSDATCSDQIVPGSPCHEDCLREAELYGSHAPRFEFAADYLREAARAYCPVEDWAQEVPEAARTRRWFYQSWVLGVRLGVVLAMMMGKLFEVPYECHPRPEMPVTCTSARAFDTPLKVAIHCIDGLAYALLLCEITACVRFQRQYMFVGRNRTLRRPSTWLDWWRCSKLLMTLLSISLYLVQLCRDEYTLYWLRLAILPVLVLEVKPSIRIRTVGTVMLFPGVLPVLIITVMLVLWYAAVALILVNSSDVVGAQELKASGNFDNMSDAFSTLYYLLTTDWQPTAFMPGVQQTVGWLLYIDSYNILMVWIMMGVLMGSVYSEYRRVLAQEIIERYAFEEELAKKAFEVLGLGEDQQLHFDNFMPLLAAALKHPDLAEKEARKIFGEEDRRKNGYLTGRQLVEIAKYKLVPGQRAPRIIWLAAFLEGPYFAWIADCFLLLECGVVFWQAITYTHRSFSYANGIIVLTLLSAEFLAKFVSLGPFVYCRLRSGWIHGEALILLMCFLTLLIAALSEHNLEWAEVLEISVAVSLLRLGQTMYRFSGFRTVMYTLSVVSHHLLEFGLVLFSFLYLFAGIGMALFGGKIYLTNPKFEGQGASLEADGSIYISINFNSVALALNSLLMLTVGNNWDVFVDTAAWVTSEAIAKVYYYLIMAILSFIFLNVIVAFFVDAYQAAASKAEGEARIGRIPARVLDMLERRYNFTMEEQCMNITKASGEETLQEARQDADSFLAAESAVIEKLAFSKLMRRIKLSFGRLMGAHTRHFVRQWHLSMTEGRHQDKFTEAQSRTRAHAIRIMVRRLRAILNEQRCGVSCAVTEWHRSQRAFQSELVDYKLKK